MLLGLPYALSASAASFLLLHGIFKTQIIKFWTLLFTSFIGGVDGEENLIFMTTFLRSNLWKRWVWLWEMKKRNFKMIIIRSAKFVQCFSSSLLSFAVIVDFNFIFGEKIQNIQSRNINLFYKKMKFTSPSPAQGFSR